MASTTEVAGAIGSLRSVRVFDYISGEIDGPTTIGSVTGVSRR